MTTTTRTQCSSCGASIVWTRTAKGRAMPVNAGSAGDQAGTLAIRRQGGELVCRVLRKGEDPLPGEYRGVAHWATCPTAGQHRKARA